MENVLSQFVYQILINLRLVNNVDSAKQKQTNETPYSMKNMNIRNQSESCMIFPYPGLHSIQISKITRATVMNVAINASMNHVSQFTQLGNPIIFNNSYLKYVSELYLDI